MDRILTLTFRVSLVAVYGFMVLPLLVTFLASISPSNQIELLPTSISLRWYGEAFSERWVSPLLYSFKLAVISALISTAFGVMGAFAVAYYRCPANAAVMSFLLSPLSAPQIVVGIALLQGFAQFGLHIGTGSFPMIACHVLVLTPFTTRMIANNIYSFDRSLQRAASVLGANYRQTLAYVILPVLKPGLFASLTFSFILSFNNIPISLFLSQTGTRTLPIAVINYLETRIDPALAAVNVVCLVIIILAVAVLEKVGKFSKTLY